MTRVLWGPYWFGAVAAMGIGIANAIAYGMDNATGGFMTDMSMVVQSFLGMMLLSGQAPTSLGEERVRGSLDVLHGHADLHAGDRLGQVAGDVSHRPLDGGPARLRRGGDRLRGSHGADAIGRSLPGIATSRPTILDVIHRLPTLVLVVAELLSYGAAITSLGLLLATWIPRPGRAIGISVAVFVLIAVGWPYAFAWSSGVRSWHGSWTPANLQVGDVNWLARAGGLQSTPRTGHHAGRAHGHARAGRVWKFNLVAMAWCLLAWAFAVAMFWMALRSFDRCLGRMRETSQGDGADVPPRLVPVGAGCQNEDR